MNDSQANPRYANALFVLAKDKGELEQIEKDFLQVIEVLKTHAEINHLVLNSTIARQEVEDLIEKVFPEKTSKTLISFIKVLIRKRRFDQITAIQSAYHKLYEKEVGVQEVEVTTPKPLSADAKKKLLSILEKKLNAKIRLFEETDSKMIGGMILRTDGREINNSYRDRLSEMKQILTQ